MLTDSEIPLTIPSAPHGVEVCISALPKDEATLLAKLPTDYATEIQKEMDTLFQSKHRRMEWLTSRYILHQVCPEARITYQPTGRPYLTNVPATSLLNEVSISHSQQLAAVCRASHRIGIDVEVWSQQALRVMPKFLTPEEQGWVTMAGDNVTEADTPEQQSRKAMLLWTAKEAAYKYFDIPGMWLTDLHILDITPTGENEWQAKVVTPSLARANLYIYSRPECAVSICLGKES